MESTIFIYILICEVNIWRRIQENIEVKYKYLWIVNYLSECYFLSQVKTQSYKSEMRKEYCSLSSFNRKHMNLKLSVVCKESSRLLHSVDSNFPFTLLNYCPFQRTHTWQGRTTELFRSTHYSWLGLKGQINPQTHQSKHTRLALPIHPQVNTTSSPLFIYTFVHGLVKAVHRPPGLSQLACDWNWAFLIEPEL